MSQPSKMFKLAPACVLVLALACATLADVDEVITSAPAETTPKAEEASTTAAPVTSTTTTAAAPAAAPAALPAAAPSPAFGLEARALFGNLGKEFGQPQEVQCKIDDIVLKAGQKHAYQNECTQLTCHHDGMITGITCPFVIAPPGCQINPQDLSKPYPQCCETWTC